MILVLTLVAPFRRSSAVMRAAAFATRRRTSSVCRCDRFVAFSAVIESTLRRQCKPSADDDAPGGEWCAICYVDALEAAPVIKLQCGHLLHFGCVQRRLAARWAGPVIGFQVSPLQSLPDSC